MSKLTVKTGQRVEHVGIYEDAYGERLRLSTYRGTVPPHPTRQGEPFLGVFVAALPDRVQQSLFIIRQTKKVLGKVPNTKE